MVDFCRIYSQIHFPDIKMFGFRLNCQQGLTKGWIDNTVAHRGLGNDMASNKRQPIARINDNCHINGNKCQYVNPSSVIIVIVV